MKLVACQHCNYENPKQRIFCLECGKRIERENQLTRIYNGIVWIAGGVFLFVADTQFDLQVVKFIPIPYALSVLGSVGVLIGLSNLLPRALTNPTSLEELIVARKKVAKLLLIFAAVLLSPVVILIIMIILDI